MTTEGDTWSAALYVVATPIGNLGDLTERARAVLAGVSCVAAEDTRRTGQLLGYLGIRCQLISLHEHNERSRLDHVLGRIEGGEAVALVTDAGTPLVSDPGQRLVRAAHERHLPVVPIPGPSAVMTALSAAGLPADRFVFEGFLPSKSASRRNQLKGLADESRTLVFFEAPHRLSETLSDMVAAFGGDRDAVLCRELTKRYETVRADTLAELDTWVRSNAVQQRGEVVLILSGCPGFARGLDAHARHVMEVLLEMHGPSDAARLAARITEVPKRELYQWALKRRET